MERRSEQKVHPGNACQIRSAESNIQVMKLDVFLLLFLKFHKKEGARNLGKNPNY
jgi:hypothetical protein